MYGVGGEHDLSERELAHLVGWRNNRPVRIGTDSPLFRPHGVYGTVLDGAYRWRNQQGEWTSGTADLLVSLADAAERHWQEPDFGMWHVHDEARHYVHSKLMCWIALDRASRLAVDFGVPERAATWTAAAESIRAVILAKGWNGRARSYTQAFGSKVLDASVLMMATTGFLPATDPRMRSTIESVATRLAAKCGLLHRFEGDDGPEGRESASLLCSYWLAECWALAGEPGRARDVFESASAYANDVGLLGEQAEHETGELLGNYPQASSHVGLINAAWAIARAEDPGVLNTDA